MTRSTAGFVMPRSTTPDGEPAVDGSRDLDMGLDTAHHIPRRHHDVVGVGDLDHRAGLVRQPSGHVGVPELIDRAADEELGRGVRPDRVHELRHVEDRGQPDRRELSFSHERRRPGAERLADHQDPTFDRECPVDLCAHPGDRLLVGHVPRRVPPVVLDPPPVLQEGEPGEEQQRRHRRVSPAGHEHRRTDRRPGGLERRTEDSRDLHGPTFPPRPIRGGPGSGGAREVRRRRRRGRRRSGGACGRGR